MHDSDRLRAAKQGLFQAEVGTQKGSQTSQRYPKYEAKRGHYEQDSNTKTLDNGYERVLVRELETSTNWRRDKTQRGNICRANGE